MPQKKTLTSEDFPVVVLDLGGGKFARQNCEIQALPGKEDSDDVHLIQKTVQNPAFVPSVAKCSRVLAY